MNESPPPRARAVGGTRRTILDLLKRFGPTDARELAERLGVSAMAVRQHLYVLRDDGFVTHEAERRGAGRPAKLWRLKPEAAAFFPDGHAALGLELIAAMRETFGEAGLERLVEARAGTQRRDYSARLDGLAGLGERLEALARIRSEEGYMATVERTADGGLLLVENHCPICVAATACQGFCRAELDLFRAVLGGDVEVERLEHIPAGARRCAYAVRPREVTSGGS